MKEYKGLVEAYQKVYEQQIGIPLDAPTDAAAARKLREILPPSQKDKIVIPKSGLQKAHYEPEGEVVIEDVYDEVLNFLLSEGCSPEESNYIMTYVVEQGMHPQEVIARGIANILGLDKPHPTEIFARGLKKMLYPNKPQPLKAPKPPAPKITKGTSPTTKPNQYRPGATVRATGPNLDKYPELQRFAGQGSKPGLLNNPIRGGGQGFSLPFGGAHLGAAVAGLQAYNTGDSTLSAALKRGDYRPPSPKPVKPKVNAPKPEPAPKLEDPKPKPAPKVTTPEDPNIKKYNELRKSDPAKAKELGMKIWSTKYRPALTSPEVA